MSGQGGNPRAISARWVRGFRSRWCGLLAGLLGLVSATSGLLAQSAPAPDAPLEYNRDIRPILSNKCFKCHGFDAHERQAGLRLDEREHAIQAADSGNLAIVPGKPEASALVQRIHEKDIDLRMPPPESNFTLTAVEKQKLTRWIAEGASYQKHWSFLAPRRPVPPQVRNESWARNAIDRFILAQLETAKLTPTPEADRATLLRRVTLDLTGLPPTPAEIANFLQDARPDAYERVVERLLRSPHYGERMTLEWLDAARYADTHGYHIDSGRDMTRWREWVIESYNQNKPFDQFTVEQLAGDLIPNATVEQKIASGFNRNHMINFEGGAIAAEYHNAYLVDRVNTLGMIWLGLTVGCCQCHDHKYDPLTQREFYQLYSFFHNIPENGLDGAKGNAAPVLKTPTRLQTRTLAELDAKLQAREASLLAPDPQADAAQRIWEQTATTAPVWTVLDFLESKSRGNAQLARQADGSILASGPNPAQETYTLTAAIRVPLATALRLEVLPDKSFPAQGPGRSANGNLVLTEVRATLSALDSADNVPGPNAQALTWKQASADFSQDTFPISQAIDGKADTGWAIFPQVGQAHQAVFEFAEPLRLSEEKRLTLVLECQSQFAQHQPGRIRVSLTDSSTPHDAHGPSANIAQIVKLAPEKRSVDQVAELRKYYREQISPEFARLRTELAALRQQRKQLEDSVPTTMVMQEMASPRTTFMLVRGQYDKPGEKVQPDVPAALPPLAADAPRNRLGLAQWLVSQENPLTARVAVNRYWQMYFGTGLVKTSDDFGSQGEWPTHPELLDWLATEFLRSGWDVRHMQRLIVTSATYRQASVVRPELLARDPENRLLARSPRLRLPAEFIRDQALSVSGLLNDRIGGASVNPYQPLGLWTELSSREDSKNWSAQVFVPSQGEDLYRRSMYTFWKRTSPPPQMLTFDAPDRETCTVRRSRTNTPLQALVLLNDPTYVEAARKLAERLLAQPGDTDARLKHAYLLVLGRNPRPAELSILDRVFCSQLAAYRAHPESAEQILHVGESPRDLRYAAPELAAWTIVSSMLLNLDETVTKN